MRHTVGFTLVELMITVAIIGILGAVAYPNYQNYVREARRTDGKAFALALAAEQEKIYLANSGYAVDAATLSAVAGGLTQSPEGYYVISPSTERTFGNATAYTVTVEATGVQATDTDCFFIQMSSTGAKTAQTQVGVDNSAVCW